ncbi:hypothetical protein [Streptomyces sp. NPDC048473]|uniref:hypothetical protein n=1 Tax=unclassified Streptomyces TaxID=2593676 RepID=UPI00370FD2F6
MNLAPATAGVPSGSLFAGADVAATAGLVWRDGFGRPRFEDDVWPLEGWADAPVQMKPTEKKWEFSRIKDPAWRVVAKELALAWLATSDERVLALPRARRMPRRPRTVAARRYHATFWFNWLHEQRIPSLSAVTQDHCEAFVKEYGVIRDADGAVIRPKSPSGLRTVVSVMQETTDYGELLSADRHRSGFRPWGGSVLQAASPAPRRGPRSW